MNKYEFDISLAGTVEAFTYEDACDALEECFGVGDYSEITVTESTIDYLDEADGN